MNDRAIETHGLEHDFGRGAVLRTVDLTVPKGAVYGLLGRNGSGKTTLIRILLGMIRARAGAVRVLGQDPALDPVAIRARIGYVPQTSDFDPQMTVGQTLRFVRRFYPMTWDDDRAVELLGRFALTESTRVEHLSGGELGRLALIAALAVDPAVLMLDEPSAALDPLVRRDFAQAVIEHMSEGEHTVLMSSHMLNEVELLADHMGILESGALLVEAPIDQLKRELFLVSARFEQPPEGLDPAPLRLRQVKDRWSIACWLRDDEHRDAWLARIEARGGRDVVVGDVALEDIFVHLVEGGAHA